MFAPRPNLLFLHSHDLGCHLGCYGVGTVRSPEIDRLAESGVRFARSYCTSPGCSPSRAALWTGLYPHQTGVQGLTHNLFGWRLAEGRGHLAQYLASHGYRTALAGGFHEDITWQRLGYEQALNDDGGLCFHPASEVAAACEAFFAQRKASADTTAAPFFLSVGLFEPHRPFNYGGASPDDSLGVAIPDYIPQDDAARQEVARKDFAGLQGAIASLDASVGQILRALEASGESENTIVVLTSDHGLPMPRAKCSLYDPGIEVALLMKGPGLVSGRVEEGLISNVDIFPTLCELLGVPVPDGLAGVSFAGRLREDSTPPRDAVFSEKTYHRSYDPIRAIRTETHKYIINFEFNTSYDAGSDILRSPIYRASAEKYTQPRAKVELYDLKTDPSEMTNLAGDPEHAELEAELRRRLVEWMRETNDPLLEGPVISPYYEDLRRELA